MMSFIPGNRCINEIFPNTYNCGFKKTVDKYIYHKHTYSDDDYIGNDMNYIIGLIQRMLCVMNIA